MIQSRQNKLKKEKRNQDCVIPKLESCNLDFKSQYKHNPNLLWFTLLCFKDTVFLQIKGFWQTVLSWHYFSNSICSLFVPMTHFGNSCSILNFLIINTFVMVFSDFSYYYHNCFGNHELQWDSKLNKCVCSDCSLDWLFPICLFLFLGLYIPWDITMLKLGQLITPQWPLNV